MNPKCSEDAAAEANISVYDEKGARNYEEGAPHLRLKRTRKLYLKLLQRVCVTARARTETPRVFDLGVGEGSVTFSLLAIGGKVSAVDLLANWNLDSRIA
jgi:hypothetical protein